MPGTIQGTRAARPLLVQSLAGPDRDSFRFDPQRRPWVEPAAASADAIAVAVLRCPTGALHYIRHDGAEQEAADVPTTLTPIRNGPESAPPSADGGQASLQPTVAAT